MEDLPQQHGIQLFENAFGQGIVAWARFDQMKINHPSLLRKQQEKMAMDALLKQHLGSSFRLEIDAFGKPWPAGKQGHISLSHSEDTVAFSFHPHTHQGIDIETIRPQLKRVAPRILHADELAQLEKAVDQQLLLQIFWGAKEAMYKAYGKKKIEFSSQLLLHKVQNTDRFNGTILLPDARWEVELSLIRPNASTFLIFTQNVEISALT